MSWQRTLLPCLLLAGCTQDFGAFEFTVGDGGARDATVLPPDRRDAGAGGANAGTGGRSGTRTGDAAVEPRPDAAPDLDGSFADGSSPPAPDGGFTDAATDAGVDANVVEPPGDPAACLAAWTDTPPGPESCGDCACDACTGFVQACLTEGSATEQGLCGDVLACAITNDCKEWDCYCTTQSCGAPGPDGNGPCAAVINAAAGGDRARVDAIIAAADPQEPLVRANAAVRCVIGSGRRAPGGEAAGQCEVPCR